MRKIKCMTLDKINIRPDQCRAARALLGWSREQLAKKSKVSMATLADFEAGKRVPYDRTLADILKALEQAGIVLISENGGGVGVRLRQKS